MGAFSSAFSDTLHVSVSNVTCAQTSLPSMSPVKTVGGASGERLSGVSPSSPAKPPTIDRLFERLIFAGTR